MKREYTTKQPKDKNIGKTFVGYVGVNDLDDMYAQSIPVFRTERIALRNILSPSYEVQVKIVRRI